jgi:hypothetical protein
MYIGMCFYAHWLGHAYRPTTKTLFRRILRYSVQNLNLSFKVRNEKWTDDCKRLLYRTKQALRELTISLCLLSFMVHLVEVNIDICLYECSHKISSYCVQYLGIPWNDVSWTSKGNEYTCICRRTYITPICTSLWMLCTQIRRYKVQ